MKFEDIENAFDFVSAHRQYEASAYVSLKTGETFWISDGMEEDELPEDLFESEDYVEIPHKNDLDLGQDLVFRFVGQMIPDHVGTVRGLFSGRGAYGRFKSFLERRDLLEQWYAFEETAKEKALRQWCNEEEFDLENISASK